MIIGEHIDYSGFSVLPMAIERDIVVSFFSYSKFILGLTHSIFKIALAENSLNKIRLANTNPKHTIREFTPLSNSKGYVEIDNKLHDWANYFKCGYKGVCETLNIDQSSSFDCLVDGTVPSVNQFFY